MHLLDNCLEAFLELAAELRAGHEGAQVEREKFFPLETVRHVAGDNAPGKALNDRGLAHAGLSDKYRVVLRPARKHLHDAADFLVPANNRVNLFLPRKRGKIAAVFFKALEGGLGVFGAYPLTAADVLEHGKNGILRDAAGTKQFADRVGRLAHGQHEVFR